MDSRYSLIAWGCEISRDPTENTKNHEAMIARLNDAIAADGWAGVTVSRLETVAGATLITIEPGPDALTMDLLRRVRAEMRARPRADNRDGQLSLAVA